MSLANRAYQSFGRYKGGTVVAIGSYWNPRTNAISQDTSDLTLPAMDYWCRVHATGNASTSTIATAINTALGTSYVSGDFHTYTSADLPQSAGTGANDA